MNDGYFQKCREVVEQAKERLTLADVWDLGPFAHQESCPDRPRVVRSPLRPDRNPSFSVFAGGKAFDDKSSASDGVKGGVWEFVKFACPEMTDAEIARLLVERAGVIWPEKRAENQSAGREDGGKPRAEILREERLALLRKERLTRERQERRRRAAWKSGPATPVDRWPQCVEERFESARQAITEEPSVLEKIARRRGWPVEWVEALIDGGLVSFPLLPWHDPGQEGARRGTAFLVEAPAAAAGGGRYPVGYHQKFYSAARERKEWIYVPFSPKSGKGRRGFMGALQVVAEERGFGPNGKRHGEAMVTDLPFVLGSCERPRLVVILEGEWDAATFWGAVGNFHDGEAGLPDLVVFGLRGAKGTEAFLRYYGRWLGAVRPRLWLFPDNDPAGLSWMPPRRLSDRAAGAVYFTEKLDRLTTRPPVVSILRGSAGGAKDFNDFYRERKPSVGDLFEWIERMKLL